MTDPAIHDLLAEPLEGGDALRPEAEHVLRHVAVAMSVVATIAPAYGGLCEQAARGGDDAQAAGIVALELAGLVAAVARSARSRPDAVAAAEAAGVPDIAVLGVLDELLHGLILLTEPADLELVHTPAELERLLAPLDLDG